MLLLIKFKMSLKSHEKTTIYQEKKVSREAWPLRSPVQGTSSPLRAQRAAQHRLPRGNGSILSVTEGVLRAEGREDGEAACA